MNADPSRPPATDGQPDVPGEPDPAGCAVPVPGQAAGPNPEQATGAAGQDEGSGTSRAHGSYVPL